MTNRPPQKNIENAKWFSSIVKKVKSALSSMLELPEQCEALRLENEQLTQDLSRQTTKIERLEDEKTKLQGEKTKLESEKAALQDEKAKLEDEKADLKQKYNGMLATNQKLTANNPTSVGGDSATTYLQWIEEYILLLRKYTDDVLDVVSDTDENIAALRDFVTRILEYGLVTPLSPNDELTIQNQVDKFLNPEYQNPESRKYKKFHHFFDDLFKLANKAEQYKESFYILVPLEARFDSRYARIPGEEMSKKPKYEGKKITRCYLPTVLFFFPVDNLAACAPALVGVEA